MRRGRGENFKVLQFSESRILRTEVESSFDHFCNFAWLERVVVGILFGVEEEDGESLADCCGKHNRAIQD